jgi:hypothetical protein
MLTDGLTQSDQRVLRAAADLVSEDAENAEYDRGVSELAYDLTNLQGGAPATLALLRGINLGLFD